MPELPDSSPLVTCHPVSGAFTPITATLLREAYLLAPPAPFAPEAALAQGGAPWEASLEAAPAETRAAIGAALRQLAEATPGLRPEDVDISALEPGSRLHTHVAALRDLWLAMDGALPPDLAIWRGVIEAEAGAAIEPLPLASAAPPEGASRAARALFDRLLADHGLAPEPARAAWQARQQGLVAGAPEATSLGHAQRSLLAGHARPVPPDGSLRFLAPANPEEEADCAAALVQAMLARDDTARARDFGLLAPADPVVQARIGRAFRARGIALSGLEATHGTVDVGAETLLNFLLALRRPAPVMALASLYTSPLMPWGQAIGHQMAAEVMAGRFDYRGAQDFPGDWAAFYRNLRHGNADDGRSLRARLAELGRVLRRDAGRTEAAHRLDRLIGDLRARLAPQPEAPPDWDLLLSLASPHAGAAEATPRTVEGVAVFDAQSLPWRPVRHLIVMGFTSGAYPQPVAGNPFFLDSELMELRRRAGLSIPTRAEALAARYARLQAQLSVARESATFLCPARDGAGVRLGLPASLLLLARTVESDRPPEDLPVPLAAANADERLFAMQEIAPRPTRPLLTPGTRQLNLGQDLLLLRRASDGTMRPQSPSRLETLLVSPLVWFLNEAGALPAPWLPEDFTILLRGNLAHDVIEHLFPAGSDLPDAADIPDRVRALADQAIRRLAPFLQARHWAVERQRFITEMTETARTWRETLATLGAEVVVNEVTLLGDARGIVIQGRADCILRLPDGQLLIVDHKKSASTKRRARMQAGWDLQLALYRDLLLRPDWRGADGLRALLEGQSDIAVAYHTMNDGALLAHGLHGAPPGSAETIDADISVHATERLEALLAEVGAGRLRLNTEADEAFFTKTASLVPYALDATPLGRAFLVADAGGEATP